MNNMNSVKMMLCALCMMLFIPQTSIAEKIQYGKYITYEGKVDANKKPNGKGKLELVYKASGSYGLVETYKDILEGVFANGTVSKAKLLLARYNGPLWINSAKFKGTVEFSIAEDRNSITYTLLDGELDTNNYNTFLISNQYPLTITRIPHSNGCEMRSGKLYKTNYNNSVSINNIPSDYFYPFNLSEVKSIIKSVTTHTTYILNGNFAENKIGTEYSVELIDGGVLSKLDNGLSYILSNKDYFYFQPHGNYKFRKTVSEGILSYEEGDYCLLIDKEGKRKGYLTKIQDDARNVFSKVMNATTLQNIGGIFYDGEAADLIGKAYYSGDAQAQYDLAMSFMKGTETNKDEQKGRSLLNQAAKNRNASAIAYLKAEEEENRKEAARKQAEEDAAWKEYAERMESQQKQEKKRLEEAIKRDHAEQDRIANEIIKKLGFDPRKRFNIAQLVKVGNDLGTVQKVVSRFTGGYIRLVSDNGYTQTYEASIGSFRGYISVRNGKIASWWQR